MSSEQMHVFYMNMSSIMSQVDRIRAEIGKTWYKLFQNTSSKTSNLHDALVLEVLAVEDRNLPQCNTGPLYTTTPHMRERLVRASHQQTRPEPSTCFPANWRYLFWEPFSAAGKVKNSRRLRIRKLKIGFWAWSCSGSLNFVLCSFHHCWNLIP